ncbi:MAG TPA: Crp/Fnr family transcriptional regulator [Candidatus Acidoferrum sp.]|jgi:CRP-like cAMP-binding protein
MTETTQQSPLLEMSELFADLPISVCADIVSMARTRDYLCRQVMFLAGGRTKETLLLTDGRAKITQVGESGTEVILRLTAPGEMIGEVGLVPGHRHSSTAVALQECKVLVWGAEIFQGALDRFPILRRNAKRILERRLDELETRFCQVSTQMASPRLAHALLRLIDQVGRKVNSHVEINVSQEALAQMTAMTSFTVSRLLTNWENQGLLRVRRQAIEISDFLPLMGLCKGR